MMLVVAILGIIGTMAVPMFRDSDLARLRAAAGTLAADLAFAQSDSIAHGDNLRYLVIDQANNAYSITTVAAPTTPITDPVGKIPYHVVFGQGKAYTMTGVTISAYSLGGDARVRFGAFGQLDQTTAGTITLAAGGRTITLTLNPVTGEVSISQIN